MESEYPVAKHLRKTAAPKPIVAHAGEMVSSDQAGIFVDSTETLQAILERIIDGLKRAGLDAELALVKATRVMRPRESRTSPTTAVPTWQSSAIAARTGRRHFLGSFTFRLLQIAPCPVLIVPTGRQRAA